MRMVHLCMGRTDRIVVAGRTVYNVKVPGMGKPEARIQAAYEVYSAELDRLHQRLVTHNAI